jgi:hypothetical protein
MACCFKAASFTSKDLAQLDPVTFFVVTELMRAGKDQQHETESHLRAIGASESMFELERKSEVA